MKKILITLTIFLFGFIIVSQSQSWYSPTVVILDYNAPNFNYDPFFDDLYFMDPVYLRMFYPEIYWSIRFGRWSPYSVHHYHWNCNNYWHYHYWYSPYHTPYYYNPYYYNPYYHTSYYSPRRYRSYGHGTVNTFNGGRYKQNSSLGLNTIGRNVDGRYNLTVSSLDNKQSLNRSQNTELLNNRRINNNRNVETERRQPARTVEDYQRPNRIYNRPDNQTRGDSRFYTSPQRNIPRQQASPQRNAPNRQQISPQRNAPQRQQASPQRNIPRQQVSPQRNAPNRQQMSPQRNIPRQQASPQRNIPRQQVSPQRSVPTQRTTPSSSSNRRR